MKILKTFLTLTIFLSTLYAENMVNILKENRPRISKMAYLAKTAPKLKRIQAIYKCGGGRYTSCVWSLIDNLQDGDKDIRKISAQYLGVLRQRVAIAPLKKAVAIEQDLDVRGSMLVALGYIGHSSVRDFIAKFLKNKDDKTRRLAAYSLGVLGDKAAINELKDLLENEKIDRNRVDIIRSLIALENIRSHRKKLVLLLNNSDRWVRFYAANYAKDLEVVEAILPLERALELEADPVIRKEIFAAYRHLITRRIPKE